MKSTEQLEREGEATRHQISETLDELRSRITAGQMLDEVLGYAQSTSGGMFLRNFRNHVVDNPLPVALIGTGLAWLMMTNGRTRSRNGGLDMQLDVEASDMRDASARAADAVKDAGWRTQAAAREYADRAASTASDVAGSVRSAASRSADAARSTAADASDTLRTAAGRSADAARNAASSAGDALRSAAERSSEAASSLIDSVRTKASSSYEATRTAAGRIGDSTAALGRAVGDRSHDFLEFCKEQPLVLAGIGIAVGAAIGAALPASDTEDDLMGEASDEIKDQVRRVSSKARNKAQSSLEQIRDEIQSPTGQPMTDDGDGRRGNGHDDARATERQGGAASTNAPMASSASATQGAAQSSPPAAPASSDSPQMTRHESASGDECTVPPSSDRAPS